MNISDTFKDWTPALIKEAELGNPDAMGILGYMYQNGTGGVEKDEAKAQAYFEAERNAAPFDRDDDDTRDNPWLGKTQAKEV